MRLHLWLGVALLLGVLDCKCSGCESPQPPAPPERKPDPMGGVGVVNETRQRPNPPALKARVELKAEWTACKADADCIQVPGDCCGCESGGMNVSIQSKAMMDVATARAAGCNDAVCTMQVSNHSSCFADAKCVAGVCTMVEDPSKAPPPATKRPRMERRIDAPIPTQPIAPAQ
jgi:hypothetical protein